jgi:hypothetical protein
MGELASVLSVCDHTISIDNSTAHLAATLGLPMSLMLTDGAAGGECAGTVSGVITPRGIQAPEYFGDLKMEIGPMSWRRSALGSQER